MPNSLNQYQLYSQKPLLSSISILKSDSATVSHTNRKGTSPTKTKHLVFIGKLALPELVSGKPQEAKTPRKPRTEADREYDRRRYAKKRDARIAAEQAERSAILKGTSFAHNSIEIGDVQNAV